jgi:2,3,4,5-tetrahydropyridine-2-carboxylate N-succinyltransferase
VAGGDDPRAAIIGDAWADPSRRSDPRVLEAVEEVIAGLDDGSLRVAEPDGDRWRVNVWVKEAVLLYFPLRGMTTTEVGPYEYHDKIPLKKGYAARGVRVVPPATARYGSFLAPGVILMPCYVNIGARVGSSTMVDTWATVGSCAQIGRDVHLSGGVGIGGVLEPVQAAPVIVEDGAFVGSRAIVVEGVRIGREAIIGAGVVLTASTPIIDVTGPEPVSRKGEVPARAVVIPGTRPRRFPAGVYDIPAALIIGHRNPSNDRKTSLNEALRRLDVPT